MIGYTIGEVILIGIGCFILGVITASIPDIELIIKREDRIKHED